MNGSAHSLPELVTENHALPELVTEKPPEGGVPGASETDARATSAGSS